MSLKDAVVVVTGASRGIGRATALALAREGAHVVCTARSTQSAPSKLPGTIDDTVREIQALGRRALAVPCNVAVDEQVEAMAQRTLAEFGRIDVLINNAAVNNWAPFLETPMKRWDLVLNVNLRGTVLCTKAFLPRMLEQGGGRIINVSSGAAEDMNAVVELGILPYAVSKAAVETFTRGLAAELRPKNIAVNCLRIEIGIVTEGARLMNPDFDFSDWPGPEVGAEALLWLCTRDLSYTGHVVTIGEVQQARAHQG